MVMKHKTTQNIQILLYFRMFFYHSYSLISFCYCVYISQMHLRIVLCLPLPSMFSPCIHQCVGPEDEIQTIKTCHCFSENFRKESFVSFSLMSQSGNQVGNILSLNCCIIFKHDCILQFNVFSFQVVQLTGFKAPGTTLKPVDSILSCNS